ncbi:MAG TPA: hypothetical protein VGP94_13715 [Tepidisphaeraceae bacterium]|nr:hypothetical protein [Tepidisphaeraceae bacterium]
MESIDASALPAEQRYPQQDFVRRWRPWELKDHKGTLLIQNLKIANATNQRAMEIALTSMDRPTPSPGEPLTFAKVIIRNCEIADVGRDELGRQQYLNVDHIRISGGGNEQPFASEVVLEDVYIHGGDALPLLIQEGKYSRITLRRVKIENAVGGVQIAAIVGGAVGDVVIEGSPGLKVSLIGRAGSIKQCIVKNSPGAVVSDTSTAIGKSGAVISEGDAEPDVGKESVVKLSTSRPSRPIVSAKLEAVVDRDGKTVHASVNGELGEDVSYVTFEAVDRFDYLMGLPVIVSEKPWKADLKPGKRGPITIRATITRADGDADRAIVGVVQME